METISEKIMEIVSDTISKVASENDHNLSKEASEGEVVINKLSHEDQSYLRNRLKPLGINLDDSINYITKEALELIDTIIDKLAYQHENMFFEEEAENKQAAHIEGVPSWKRGFLNWVLS